MSNYLRRSATEFLYRPIVDYNEAIQGGFNTWDTLYRAMLEYYSTEFYSNSYPNMEKVINEGWWKPIMTIKQLLSNGHSAQEGLDKYIMMAMKGNRYFMEGIKESMQELNVLMDAGAILTQKNEAILIEIHEDDHTHDFSTYQVKGFLIDYFAVRYGVLDKNPDWPFENYTNYEILESDMSKFYDIPPGLMNTGKIQKILNIVESYADWAEIKACYWEYSESIETFRASPSLEIIKIKDIAQSYLKDCSIYLQLIDPKNRVQARTAQIKEELMMAVWIPARVLAWEEAGVSMD